MKRFLAVFLMLAILLTGLTVTANAATTGWKKLDDGTWTYVKADGKLAEDEWIKDGGAWYYFMGTTMVTGGPYVIEGKWYAFNKSGAMIANDWFEEKWVYNGTAYSQWYYAGADGAFVKGWQKINNTWYYFETELTGTDVDEETGNTYDWYRAPYMYSACETMIGKKYYAFAKSGAMIVGWGQPYVSHADWGDWVKDYWVYANDDGSLAEGWKKIDGKWYYLAPVMVRDTVIGIKDGEIDWGKGCTYYAFDKSGAMIENAWYAEDWGEGEKGWYYLGKDGAAKTGWIKDNGKWYYLDQDYAYMYHWGFTEMNDGSVYYLDLKTGEMKTGWIKDGEDWYYFKDSGAMAKKEWVKGSDGKWYYLKENGEMAKSETLTIKGKEYKFGADGAWIEK